MATEKKPTKLYFIINIGVVVIIVLSAAGIYLKFFADKPDEEATNIEKEETEPVDVSRRVSKAAFTFALFLGVILLVLFLINKLSRRKTSQF